jgi:hypothetical protein
VLKVYFDAQPDRWFVDKYLARSAPGPIGHGLAPERIIMGEFGALRTDAAMSPPPIRIAPATSPMSGESAEALGFPWAFWDLFDGMGMMDDTTRRAGPRDHRGAWPGHAGGLTGLNAARAGR